jgi:hypothetical protein
MIAPTYIQPVAYHRDHVHRLLLTDEVGAWFLWHGDFTGLTEIDCSLAQWIYQRPEIYPMPGTPMWYEVSTLPVVDSGLQSILGD